MHQRMRLSSSPVSHNTFENKRLSYFSDKKMVSELTQAIHATTAYVSFSVSLATVFFFCHGESLATSARFVCCFTGPESLVLMDFVSSPTDPAPS